MNIIDAKQLTQTALEQIPLTSDQVAKVMRLIQQEICATSMDSDRRRQWLE